MPDSRDWRDALRDQLKRHEELRLMPYRDTIGKLSIAWGRNLDDKGVRIDEAELMLSNDISEVFEDLDRALPWWRKMDDVRKRVLADMSFNLGITKLLMFKNTLAAMKAGDYGAAADGMVKSRWYRQTKSRAKRLVAMMRFGEENPPQF